MPERQNKHRWMRRMNCCGKRNSSNEGEEYLRLSLKSQHATSNGRGGRKHAFPSPGGRGAAVFGLPSPHQRVFRVAFVKGCPDAVHPAYCPLTTLPAPVMGQSYNRRLLDSYPPVATLKVDTKEKKVLPEKLKTKYPKNLKQNTRKTQVSACK